MKINAKVLNTQKIYNIISIFSESYEHIMYIFLIALNFEPSFTLT
ncbi:hypothetical protein NIES4074_47790 [Cylindrospermum sp. NIES-4074]|nr:hypothetical protein NIES4074_47790 [Cylindrospermum sp. NIES-4074]